MNAIGLYRVGRWLHKRGFSRLAKLSYYATFLIFNSSVPPSADIGEGTRFAYGGIGVVIHGRCRIGRRVTIGQHVTLGGRNRMPGVPVVGDDCYLAAGSRILGPIHIGDGAIVGANAVVLDDVPARSIVAGVPARVIRQDINVADYI